MWSEVGELYSEAENNERKLRQEGTKMFIREIRAASRNRRVDWLHRIEGAVRADWNQRWRYELLYVYRTIKHVHYDPRALGVSLTDRRVFGKSERFTCRKSSSLSTCNSKRACSLMRVPEGPEVQNPGSFPKKVTRLYPHSHEASRASKIHGDSRCPS